MTASFAEPRTFGNFIDGDERDALSGASFTGCNPTAGQEWGVFADSGADDVDRAVRSAREAFGGVWSRLTPTERGRRLYRWGTLISENAERIAQIEATQNGKLLAELLIQVRAAEEWLHYYGGLADKIEGAVIPVTQSSVLNYTLREPLGVVAAILPWNSPTFHTVMAVAPILAVGNVVVIKPSEVTSASAVEIARLALDAGIPPGVISVVTGQREAGEALVDHPDVAKISFIGSVPAGRKIAERASRRLATSTLELGGKSPNIVFADADLELAELGIVSGIFAAAGQTCIAGSRAYIHESRYDELVARIVDRADRITIGDPFAPETQMGPIATAAQLAKDDTMVAQAVAEGAHVLTGGGRASVPDFPDGFFYAPTVIENARPGDQIITEEVFGPVLTVTPFRDEDEVLQLANDSRFGLGAGVWTNDLRRAHRMARGIQAGTVWINTYRALAAQSPFGGFKQSGNGRNNGLAAVEQYMQTKSVWCELGTDPIDPFVIRVGEEAGR